MRTAKYITEKNYFFKHYHDSEQISGSVDTKVTMQRHQTVYVCILSLFSQFLPFLESQRQQQFAKRSLVNPYINTITSGSSYWCWHSFLLYVKSGMDKEEKNRREECRNNIFILSSLNREANTDRNRKILCIHNPDYPKCWYSKDK